MTTRRVVGVGVGGGNLFLPKNQAQPKRRQLFGADAPKSFGDSMHSFCVGGGDTDMCCDVRHGKYS